MLEIRSGIPRMDDDHQNHERSVLVLDVGLVLEKASAACKWARTGNPRDFN